MSSENTEPTALVHAKTFRELIPQEDLYQAIAALNFPAPTPVQAAVIPNAMSGKDLVIQAKTGSGKTLAFVLPLLARLEQIKKTRGTFGLIISPTRELAVQICEVIKSLTKDITPACIIGGEKFHEQEKALNFDNRIVVGTPGRLMDLIRQRTVVLRSCQYFVLDEADEMLSMGFLEEVRAILSRLPDQRQGLFVSATITPRVEVLATSFLYKAERVVINTVGEERAPIEHFVLHVSGELTAKANMLCDVIEAQRPTSAVIFCNTKSDTELVEVLLRRRGFDARRINSDLTQRERNLIMSQIRSGDLKLLIATDIAARGLDIEHIDLVINYSIPAESEVYVHRTGRTGRAGRSGRAVALVGPQDFTSFTNLKRFLGFELMNMPPPTEAELTDARVAHFHEIVRAANIEVQSKEIEIAKKLLSDLGAAEEPTEECAQFIAKLYRLTLDQMSAKAKPQVSAEAHTLDENSEQQERPRQPMRDSRNSNSRRPQHSRDRSRR